MLVDAIEMALARAAYSARLHPSACVFCYWNGEDPPDEIERRIAAICILYKINRKTTSKAGWRSATRCGASSAWPAWIVPGNVVINQAAVDYIEAFIQGRCDRRGDHRYHYCHSIVFLEAKNELMEDWLASTLWRHGREIQLLH